MRPVRRVAVPPAADRALVVRPVYRVAVLPAADRGLAVRPVHRVAVLPAAGLALAVRLVYRVAVLPAAPACQDCQAAVDPVRAVAYLAVGRAVPHPRRSALSVAPQGGLPGQRPILRRFGAPDPTTAGE